MRERVVVTGIGVISPIGTGRDQFWKNLLAGECGIDAVQSFDTQRYPVHRGAEVKDFDPSKYVRSLAFHSIGRASQFAIGAARLALEDAQLDLERIVPDRAGLSIGTTSGEPNIIEAFDDAYLSGGLDVLERDYMLRYPSHVIAAHVAGELGFEGLNLTIPCACAAGNHAIAHAFDQLRAVRADLMLAGGADAFSRITYTGFARLGAVAPHFCQPFDRNRRGMIPGEGAAILVLERLDTARRRGARIYAEIAGYGSSCDAHHMTASHPQGEGAARAMKRALRMSNTDPSEVDYISAHGTGTPTNDRLETIAVKSVFGDDAHRVPMSSIKSMLGHTMGAAPAFEAAACAMAVDTNSIPPTIHFEERDPECDLDCVPNQARQVGVRVAMSNAYAFGGNNSSLVVKSLVA
jgi:3-oxoacyl-[acyl-carrier-protein] synthase II